MRHRRAGVLAAALVIACTSILPAAPATPAAAADTIQTQWYLKPTGLADLKAKGLDGTGVKIAIIDVAPPDLTVPELRDADVKVVAPCSDKPQRSWVKHATEVTSILASPDYGWAPRASYTVYVELPEDSDKIKDRDCVRKKQNRGQYLIEQALNDGADLISIQIEEIGSTGGYEMARAAVKGVPVVVGVGNNGKDYAWGSAAMNTVVGVGAVDSKNKHATFSTWGDAVTVVAPGVDVTTRAYGSDGKLSTTRKSSGTSLATPMVSGALALAMQAWPDANGNQLIRTLIATADGTNGAHDPYLGWGVLDARELVATDPSGQSTENPLLDKDPRQSPTTQEYQDYRDGVADVMNILNDNDYVYRGDDELICEDAPRCELGTSPRLNPSASASPSATLSPAAGASPSAQPASSPSTPLVPITAGIAAIALAAAGAALGLVLLRRRNQPPPADNEPPA